MKRHEPGAFFVVEFQAHRIIATTETVGVPALAGHVDETRLKAVLQQVLTFYLSFICASSSD